MKRFWPLLVALLAGCADKPAPPPAAASGFDGERAYSLLKELCLMGARDHGSDRKEKAEAWIAERMKACGAEVTVHTFKHRSVRSTGEETFRNIVARFRPSEPKRVLLGTHYDTRSWADHDPRPDRRGWPIVGANDGGSGVAVLLALAETWKSPGAPCGIDVIFFDGEDYGHEGDWDDYFLGSKAWVRDHPDYKCEWGVILDMVGDIKLEIPREVLSQKKAPAVVDRVWAAAKRAGATAFVDEQKSSITDDQVAFLDKGLPVILVIDFDYPAWHTDDDDPNHCSAASLGQVGKTLVEALKGAP